MRIDSTAFFISSRSLAEIMFRLFRVEAISLYSVTASPKPFAAICLPMSNSASNARRKQDSAAQIFRVSYMNDVLDSKGKARISLNILSTHARRSLTILFEIFPGTMLSLLQDHCHTLTFQLRQIPCAA